MFFPALTRRPAYVGAAGIYTYRRYKSEILEDCAHRCVYCDGHGNSFGGHEMMELDHFRPKAAHLFPELRDDPGNLVLACRSCNGKKRDDWPAGTDTAATHVAGLGYIDPFAGPRAAFFKVEVDGSLTPLRDPARYMIEQLCLNRRFASAIRARRVLRQALHAAIAELTTALRVVAEQPRPQARIGEIADLIDQANAELQKLFDENELI